MNILLAKILPQQHLGRSSDLRDVLSNTSQTQWC